MAGKFCTKCGSPTVVGKRFCGKCGQPVAQPALSTDAFNGTAVTEPVQQTWSLVELAPKAVLGASQTATEEERSLSNSDADIGIPSSQPDDNQHTVAGAVPGAPEPAVAFGFFQSGIYEMDGPSSVESEDLPVPPSPETPPTASAPTFGLPESLAGKGSPTLLASEAPEANSTDKFGMGEAKSSSDLTSRKRRGHTVLFSGVAAFVLVLAGAVTWIYVSHTRAKIGKIPLTTGTAQTVVKTPNARGSSENGAKPSAALPPATQQDLPSNSGQSAPPGDVLLKNLPKPVGYVNDFAHVLSPEVIAQLDRACGRLERSQANAQVAVVTINTLNGADIADFGKQLFNKWGIGPRASNRGVLVLLAVNDHKYRIATGYGLESTLTDAKAAEIGRSAVPLLDANNFDGGVTAIVAQVTQVIADDTKTRLDTASVPTPSPSEPLTSVPTPPPSEPLTGVLHYIGSPVPFGGIVVFANLPGDRLSFTFDHQAWQPLISRQPDGTQKLTLRSLKHEEQTQCDVEWRVIK